MQHNDFRQPMNEDCANLLNHIFGRLLHLWKVLLIQNLNYFLKYLRFTKGYSVSSKAGDGKYIKDCYDQYHKTVRQLNVAIYFLYYFGNGLQNFQVLLLQGLRPFLLRWGCIFVVLFVLQRKSVCEEQGDMDIWWYILLALASFCDI